MSLSLKVISLVSSRKAPLDRVSTIRHPTPTLEASLPGAYVAILLSLAVNSSWSNRFLNQELLCKVMMAPIGNEGLSSSLLPKLVLISIVGGVDFPELLVGST